MKKKYEEQLILVSSIDNNSEKLTYLTSVLRSLLQTSVVTALELVKAQTPSDEIEGLSELCSRLRKPTDGLPIQILDSVIPFLRRYLNTQFAHGWFEPYKLDKKPLNRLLVEWVEFRNKRPGHGVLDRKIINEWVERTETIISICLRVFGSILPIQNGSCSTKLSKDMGSLNILTPLLFKGEPIVIISAVVRKGIWKLKGQILSLTSAEEFTVNLPEDNVFSIEGLKGNSEYLIADITSNDIECSFFHNLPVRQTDTFEGRQEEISDLIEWMDDKDSRYCLVFGDGGYGKTTLVLEFLNQIVDDELDFSYTLPIVISYHTAKMTKWTEEGLTHFTGIIPVVDDCIRELMRCFFPTLPSEWYAVSGRSLIDKAVGVLRDNKMSRDDVLLIMDNTETLATTSQEVKSLGESFKIIGKLIGRVIITSRRREFIQATPILVEGLSELESIRLMKRIAQEYHATPVLQAGESKLKKISSQLMYKPILLEALVKYISHSNIKIDSAIDNVFKKSNEELLEFLYDDAWVRMNPLHKDVFMLIPLLSSPLDEVSISQACSEIGIQHSEFQSSLVETHFGVLTDYGKNYSLEMVDLASRFFRQRFGKINSTDKDRIKLAASSVDKYYKERKLVEREYKSDRVAEAFRSEYAKSAKVCVSNGDISGAIEMYKLAIEDDPLNSALHDRFSWFLLNKCQDYEYAIVMSKKAVKLDPNNCDALVGMALAFYSLKDISNGDQYIDIARDNGRPLSFCLLRKSIARYHKAKDEPGFVRSIEALEEAEEMLNMAEKRNKNLGGYDVKNLNNILKYQGLTKTLLATYRGMKARNRVTL